eukprot:5876424-Amphidinium_carterae.1
MILCGKSSPNRSCFNSDCKASGHKAAKDRVFVQEAVARHWQHICLTSAKTDIGAQLQNLRRA